MKKIILSTLLAITSVSANAVGINLAYDGEKSYQNLFVVWSDGTLGSKPEEAIASVRQELLNSLNAPISWDKLAWFGNGEYAGTKVCADIIRNPSTTAQRVCHSLLYAKDTPGWWLSLLANLDSHGEVYEFAITEVTQGTIRSEIYGTTSVTIHDSDLTVKGSFLPIIVTLDAQGGSYVVSNLTAGAEGEIGPTEAGGSTYALPYGAKVGIYMVPEVGYVVTGDPYIIDPVQADVTIDESRLPKAVRREQAALEAVFGDGAVVTPITDDAGDPTNYLVTVTKNLTGPVVLPEVVSNIVINLAGYSIEGAVGAAGSATTPGGDGGPAIVASNAAISISFIGPGVVKGGKGGKGNPSGGGGASIADADGNPIIPDHPDDVTVASGDSGEVVVVLPDWTADYGYTYAVSNILSESSELISPIQPGGTVYELPVGRKVCIYAVPAEGYAVMGGKHCEIASVERDTIIDFSELPMAGRQACVGFCLVTGGLSEGKWVGDDWVASYKRTEPAGTFDLSIDADVRYLVVGGGGAGGNSPGGTAAYAASGGGGAGGFLTGSRRFGDGPYQIVVGAGAPAVAAGVGTIAAEYTPGGNGDPSEIKQDGETYGGLLALGGGGGGSNSVGKNGGSGGGGGAFCTMTTTTRYPGGAGESGQGNGGGQAVANYGVMGMGGYGCGGGGGGAGTTGETPTTSSKVGGAGGDGLPSDITGVEVYYAGGGGGGTTKKTSEPVHSAGGKGGGGYGACSEPVTDDVSILFASSGEPNTGGGGGGGATVKGEEIRTGAGGSGIVVLRVSPRGFGRSQAETVPVLDGDGALVGFDVKMIADVVGPVEIPGGLGNVKIDLNGRTISGTNGVNGTTAWPGTAGGPALVVGAGTTLTVVSTAAADAPGAIAGGNGGDGNPVGKGSFAIVDDSGAEVSALGSVGLVRKGLDGNLLKSPGQEKLEAAFHGGVTVTPVPDASGNPASYVVTVTNDLAGSVFLPADVTDVTVQLDGHMIAGTEGEEGTIALPGGDGVPAFVVSNSAARIEIVGPGTVKGGKGGDGNPPGKGAPAVVDADGNEVVVTAPDGIVSKGDDGESTEPEATPITSIELFTTGDDQKNVSVMIAATPGKTYQLLRSEDLMTPVDNWDPIKAEQADDDVLTLVDPNPPAKQAFYRVMRRP